MSEVVGYATIQLIPSIEGLSERVNAQLGAPLESSSRSAGQRSGSALGSGFFGSVGRIMGAAAIYQIGSSIGSGIGNGIKTGLQQASFMQSAQQSFETLLGSGGKAEQLLTSLSNFAAKTPFDIQGATQASQKLLGAGESAKQIIPTLTALGDANAAVGGSQDAFNESMLAYSQIMTRGKLDTQDLYQLSNAGIPIWKELAKAVGQPTSAIQDMVSKGQLAADDTLPKLEAQLEKDYGGAMAKQATTLAGVWSTVTDTIKTALGQAFLPLAPVLANILPGAASVAAGAITGMSHGIQAAAGFLKDLAKNPAVQQFGSAIASTFAQIGPQVSGPVHQIIDGFAGLGPGLASILPLFTPFGTIFKALLPVIPPVAGALAQLAAGAMPMLEAVVVGLIPVANSFVSTITALAQVAMPIVQQVISAVIPELLSLQGTFESLAGALIGPLFAAITQIAQQIGSVLITVLGVVVNTLLPPLIALFQQLVPVVLNVITAFMPLVTTIISQLLPAFTQIITMVLPPLMALFQALVPLIMPLIGVLGQVVMVIASALVPIIQALMPVVQTVITTIIGIVTPIVQIISGIISVLAGLLSGNWKQVWTGAKDILQGVWNLIVGVVTGAINLVGSVIRAGLSIIATVWNAGWAVVGTILQGAWNTVKTVVENGWNAVKGVFSHFGSDIQSAFSGAGQWLASVASDMWSGFKNAWNGFVGGLSNLVTGPFKAAVDGVKSLLGIHSPSRVFRDIAGHIADGFTNGMASRAKDIQGAYDVFGAPDIAGVDVSAQASGFASLAGSASAASSSGVSIGSVTFAGSDATSSDLDELNFYLRHLARGGR